MRPLELVGTFGQASALLSRLAPATSSSSSTGFSSDSDELQGANLDPSNSPTSASSASVSPSVLLALINLQENAASPTIDCLVALAKRKTLIVSHLITAFNPKSDAPQIQDSESVHHFDNACGIIEENVTMIEWLRILSSAASSSTNEKNPLLRHRHSKEKAVLVCGTSAGWVRFFTERGRLLHQKQFQKGAVIQIKIRNASLCSHTVEDVTVLYATNPAVVVRIDGRSLCKFLRHRCSQTNSATQEVSNASTTADEVSTFSYHIWGMASPMNDALICGGYADASNLDIYHSKISGGSKILRVIGVGGDPIISTYQIPANDIASSNVLSTTDEHADSMGSLASTVATRLGVAFRSPDVDKTLSSNSHLAQSPPPSLLPINSEFHDSPREVFSIVPSPGHLFAASSDNLGRVILWDIQGSNPVAIRIIKGVREAQLSWIFHKRTLFCAIYFPRRNLLEVLDLFSGKRVVSRFLGALGNQFTLLSGGTVVNMHTATVYRIVLS